MAKKAHDAAHSDRKIFKTKYEIPERVRLITPEPTRTKQSFRDETDINNILSRFKKTGQLPNMIQREPRYGDFSDVASYQESLDNVRKAHEQFEALPAKLRDRFQNDPARFLAFVEDPANGPELVRMGLATAREPQPPSQPSPASPGASQAPKKGGSSQPASPDDA